MCDIAAPPRALSVPGASGNLKLQWMASGTVRGVSSALISIDHDVMGGAPCISGTRIPVATVVSMLAEGSSVADVLVDFPQLSAEAISAALQFAADAVRERELPLPA